MLVVAKIHIILRTYGGKISFFAKFCITNTVNIMTNPEIERIYQLREELHTHNYNYYVMNSPIISDMEFDMHDAANCRNSEAKISLKHTTKTFLR